MLILSGDIGGTTTRLQLSNANHGKLNIIGHEQYSNAEFDSLNTIMVKFLKHFKTKTMDVNRCCLAVAGPIINNTVKFTNLPWFVDAAEIKTELGITNVALINDFQAIGYGIETLTTEDVITLQKGKPNATEPKAIIGAGTGLGVGIMHHDGKQYNVLATEGGHVDFAPTDDEQVQLLLYLRNKFRRVSTERVVSGIGLTNIYKFVRDTPTLGEKEHPKLKLALYKSDDIGSTIAEFAIQHQDSMALRALSLFIRAYGSAAGNLALTTLCFGGLYLVGGIAPKLLAQLKQPTFINAFSDKGRMSKLIKDIPIYVVLNTRVGLQGAAVYASRHA